VAADEDGRVLMWTGATAVPPAAGRSGHACSSCAPPPSQQCMLAWLSN
jgi:hypothetical protein